MGERIPKERVDVLVVRQGLAESRAEAQRLIRAGEVFAGTARLDKPGVLIAADTLLRCARKDQRYVSRGGRKLAAALYAFRLDVAGCVAIDLGASTGGFVDCLLQHGAGRVIAVDVGRGLLDARLAADPRVTVLDRCNARYLTVEQTGCRADVITMDLSFISLIKVLPAARELLAPQGVIVALIKPQFEAGKGCVPRGGVIRDPAVHRRVLLDFRAAVAALGLTLRDATVSPIAGASGNREFFGLLTASDTAGAAVDDARLQAVLDAATEQ